MIDERLDRSLDRLETLAESIRDLRNGEWLTTPCDALVSTVIKSNRTPAMEVVLGWLCPPQMALEVDGGLFPFDQLKHFEITDAQRSVLLTVEDFLAGVWGDQILRALPADTYGQVLSIVGKIGADPQGMKFHGWRPTDDITFDSTGDHVRLLPESQRSEDYEMWRKGIIPFMNYQIRRKLRDAGYTGCSDVVDDTGADVDADRRSLAGTPASGRDERGDYEMCDDDRINKLESRVAALEKMAGDLYGRTTKNKGAIEALTADEVRSEEKQTITVTKEDLEKYSGDFTVPAAGYCLGENMWLDDLNQQLIVIGRTPQTDQVRIFRVFFGGVGRDATEVLLYIKGDDMQLCLPGETFLKTIDEVWDLLNAGKLGQTVYWEMLLNTLKSWEVK